MCTLTEFVNRLDNGLGTCPFCGCRLYADGNINHSNINSYVRSSYQCRNCTFGFLVTTQTLQQYFEYCKNKLWKPYVVE